MLLAALLVERQWEITDTLVELLISTVHAINARADRRVTEELVASFKRVRNKTVLLAKISQASLDRPDGAVGEVVFPGRRRRADVAGGGGRVQGQRTRVPPQRAGQAPQPPTPTITAAAMKLPEYLTFRRATHQPVMRSSPGSPWSLNYANSQLQSSPRTRPVPVAGIVDGDWVDLPPPR